MLSLARAVLWLSFCALLAGVGAADDGKTPQEQKKAEESAAPSAGPGNIGGGAGAFSQEVYQQYMQSRQYMQGGAPSPENKPPPDDISWLHQLAGRAVLGEGGPEARPEGAAPPSWTDSITRAAAEAARPLTIQAAAYGISSARPPAALSPQQTAAVRAELQSLEPRIGEDPRAQAYFGQAYNNIGDSENAYRHYDNAVAQGQTDAPTLTGYALAASRLGAHDVAERASALALEQDPQEPVALSINKLSKGRAPEVELPSALKAEPEERPRTEKAAAAKQAPFEEPETAPSSRPVSEQVQALVRRALSAVSMREYGPARELADHAVQI